MLINFYKVQSVKLQRSMPLNKCYQHALPDRHRDFFVRHEI